MPQKSRPMAKRQFRIGELATALNVEKYVIRFWEKEFNLSATRSEGGQRFYTSDDLRTFIHIKDLLYTKGYTIAGARQQLAQKPVSQSVSPARSAAQQQQCQTCKRNALLQQELETLAIKVNKLQKQLNAKSKQAA